jgi:enamine deaminase RidA (YjgF/YER057c/UK114 family)
MLRTVLLALLGAYSAVAKTPIVVPGWPQLPLPFSSAVLSESGTLHISGMQGTDFSKQPPALVPGGITEQTKQTLANVEAIANAAGGSMDDILECMVILADFNDFKTMNSAYGSYFTDGAPPARVTFQAGLGGGALVEIKCTGEISK